VKIRTLDSTVLTLEGEDKECSIVLCLHLKVKIRTFDYTVLTIEGEDKDVRLYCAHT